MQPRWRGLAALTLARASMGFQFQSIAAVGPLISADLGLHKAQLGWLIGLYLLPGVAFALPGGLLGRRFGDKRLVLVGLALMVLGAAGLALAESFAAANAARFTSGIGAVMLNVLMTKMVADTFESRERVLAMSILINAWPIGIGLALLVIGPLGQLAGWPWGIASSALLAAIGLILVRAIYREPSTGVQSSAAGLGLAVLSRREWQLLAIGSLPWLLYNAAFQIEISFLPSFLVEGGLTVAEAGGVVAASAVVFIVSVQAGGLVLERARRPDLVCHPPSSAGASRCCCWPRANRRCSGSWSAVSPAACRRPPSCRSPPSSCAPRAAAPGWASSTRSTTAAARCCRRSPAASTTSRAVAQRSAWRLGWRCCVPRCCGRFGARWRHRRWAAMLWVGAVTKGGRARHRRRTDVEERARARRSAELMSTT